MDARTYAALTLRTDAPDSETHRAVLELSQRSHLHDGQQQKDEMDALWRMQSEQFLNKRREEQKQQIREPSERRLQLRAACRERWQDEPPLTLGRVQELVPSLFRQLDEPRTEKPQVNRVPAKPEPLYEPQRQVTSIPTPPPPSTNFNFNRAPANANNSSAPPTTEMASRKYMTNQGPLGDFLRKKSAPSSPEEIPQYGIQPNRQIQPNPRSRNPFQTAGDKLQHDRMTGKTRDEDDHGDGRNKRLKKSNGPGRHGYHPINQNVLLGGGRNTGDEDENYDRSDSAIAKKFVSPLVRNGDDKNSSTKNSSSNKQNAPPEEEEDVDPRLKSCDPELIAKIEMEIVDYGDPIAFDDIAGLQFAKKCVNELVVWPMARPDIFKGLRTLPKGLLLFGPPGTGKTLIGKAIANQSGATFFSISASSLTSKWIGEGEKLVRTLFAVAAVKQPSVIFIDEIDSLLTQRSSEENEASRRMKTEFLVQLDGAGTKANDVILVVGATNRPQELDEAARRRFVKRLYIPLPSAEARLEMVNRLLRNNTNDLSDEHKLFIADATRGYSGADVRALCTEAAMGPIRGCADITTMDADSVRPISLDDFKDALRGVRSSVATKDLEFYKQWNDEFGSFAFQSHED